MTTRLNRPFAPRPLSDHPSGPDQVLRRFSLATDVRATVASHAARAGKKNIRLSTWIPSALPAELEADREGLRLVVSYFVCNAIHSSSGGSIVVTPQIVTETAHEVVVRFDVLVEEIGGAARLNLSQALRGGEKLVGECAWSPISLATHRDLSYFMDGEVGLESNGSGGARFWFTVGLKRPGRPESAPRGGLEPRRWPVLLLSSDPERTGEVLVALLQEGYVVMHEEDRGLMREILAQSRFSMVLIDGEEPRRVGTVTCREPGGHPRPVPVVGVPVAEGQLDDARLIAMVRHWSGREAAGSGLRNQGSRPEASSPVPTSTARRPRVRSRQA